MQKYQHTSLQKSRNSLKSLNFLNLLMPLSSILLFTSSLAQAFPAQFALGPDNNQTLVLSTIRSAKKTLDINVYQLDHPRVVDAILEKITQGVQVNLLIEGHPVGGISPAGNDALVQIKEAMNKKAKQTRSGIHSHLYVMTNKNKTAYDQRGQKEERHLPRFDQDLEQKKSDRRYRFDHAKYILVDQQKALVSSENLTLGGHANPGQKGSRGWDILVNDSHFTQELSSVLNTDMNYPGDIVDLTEDTSYETHPHGPKSGVPVAGNSRHGIEAIPEGQGEVKAVALITSPDSLAGLVNMIHSAKISIEVEEMSLPETWQMGENRQIQQNPIFTALIEAARRGVQVKILLNDDSVFERSPHESGQKNSAPKNEQTRSTAQRMGVCDQLPIKAAIIDVEKAGITYIHNKGFIIDHQKVLISSINGTQNSVMNNREVAVLVESTQAAQYFETAFQSDWKNALPSPQVDCFRPDLP